MRAAVLAPLVTSPAVAAPCGPADGWPARNRPDAL